MANRDKEPFIVQRGGRNTYLFYVIANFSEYFICEKLMWINLYDKIIPNEESKWNILYDVYEDC